MDQVGLFDWLASKKEKEAEVVPPTGIIPARGLQFEHWKMTDDRPMFRISSSAAMSRNSNEEYRQRTYIAHIGTDSPIGGLVYPTTFLNASYGFELEGTRIKGDNKELCRLLQIDDPTNSLTAYEWDFKICYRPTEPNKPLETVEAWIMAAKFMPRIRPQFSPALPIPSENQEWRCITSGTTRQALRSLSDALAGDKPPLVLITGSPGSGKEAYAAALHYGRNGNWNESKMKPRKNASASYKTCSLAGKTVRTLDDWLDMELKGIEAGGTVFFDESDKPKKDVRSHLLRLLEQRKYQPEKGGDEIKCKKITFIVGAGKRLSDIHSVEPPDFWTRMEHHIEVGDPLMAPTDEERQAVLKGFFLHFWWDTVSSWLEGIIKDPNKPNWDKSLRNETRRQIAETVFKHAIGTIENGILKSSPPIANIAALFAENLAPHLERRELSVRGLRSCVKSITWEVGSCLLGLATGSRTVDVEGEFVERGRKAVARAVGTVIQVLPA